MRSSNAIKLASVLGVTADWLFDDKKGWPPGELAPNQAPPVAIVPWPPHGITWIEVQQAINEYVARRYEAAMEQQQGELEGSGSDVVSGEVTETAATAEKLNKGGK
jgi:hypothetical protein